MPDIVTTAESSVTVAWEAPESDGGSPIIGYIVERSEIAPTKSGRRPSGPSTKRNWIKANKQPVKETELKVTGLINKAEYVFRVLAVNAAGSSPPSEESEPAIARVPVCKFTLLNL